MLENTATPLSLKSRNKNQHNAASHIHSPLPYENPDYQQQKRSRQVQFDLSKGNSLHYLKELSTSKQPILQQQQQQHNINQQVNKENTYNYRGSSPSILKQLKPTRGVTFKDEMLAAERVFTEKQYQQYSTKQNQNRRFASLPMMSSYPEQFKNYSKQLDRFQSAYSQSGHYENQEIFHEEIEKSYIEQHQNNNNNDVFPQAQSQINTDSDALAIAKSTISTHNFIRRSKHTLLTAAFASSLIIIASSSLFTSFNLFKLMKAILLVTSVIALRTFSFQKQFENGMKAINLKSLCILSLLAIIEFFCLIGFSTEIFLALLPSNFTHQIYWIAPSCFIALMETIWYWSENQSRRKTDTLIEMKRETVSFYISCAKKYLTTNRFFKESLICIISSTVIVTICQHLSTTSAYFSHKFAYPQSFQSRSYTIEEAHLLLNPTAPSAAPSELDYYVYICAITVFTRLLLSLITTFNYHLLRYSVAQFLGKYVCYQPLYTIIFAYPSVFSDYIQNEAIKYWYTYQTAPLSQVIERTQFSSNLSDSESKVVDTIFSYIGKEINSVLIELSLHDGSGYVQEGTNQQDQQSIRELKSYFIKDRRMEALLHKQRFLQTVLKFTLITISHSARVFNRRIVDFLHSITSGLDQLLQVFEKQSNYYTAEIADIIILKKEIVSNLQYIFSKMNSTFKTSGISSLTLALISDSDHIYNEYDLHSKFTI